MWFEHIPYLYLSSPQYIIQLVHNFSLQYIIPDYKVPFDLEYQTVAIGLFTFIESELLVEIDMSYDSIHYEKEERKERNNKEKTKDGRKQQGNKYTFDDNKNRETFDEWTDRLDKVKPFEWKEQYENTKKLNGK
eukprot:UN29842